jgi:hypothetical protein
VSSTSKLRKVRAVLRLRNMRQGKAAFEFTNSSSELRDIEEAERQKDKDIAVFSSEYVTLYSSSSLNPIIHQAGAAFFDSLAIELGALAAAKERQQDVVSEKRQVLVASRIKQRLFEKLADDLLSEHVRHVAKKELENR